MSQRAGTWRWRVGCQYRGVLLLGLDEGMKQIENPARRSSFSDEKARRGTRYRQLAQLDEETLVPEGHPATDGIALRGCHLTNGTRTSQLEWSRAELRDLALARGLLQEQFRISLLFLPQAPVDRV